ncbi:HpcH/HpaI aldolase/citrate lyase family protein [Altererythrobacter sp. MF3-039]|uniref:HpcH/HpaI aldolase/citrate lyase family protein n=1 Tax=Altererythrobacter sp. MF3-039 TaxID=3252901 RepID=UPI00390C4B41
MKSWLIVRADEEEQLAMAATSGAGVVVADCGYAASDRKKEEARMAARDWLSSHRQQVLAQGKFERWARISPIHDPAWRADLEVVMQAGPDGLLLPECSGPDQLQQLAAEIYEVEQRNGVAHGATRIVPQVGTRAGDAMRIRAFAEESHPRLAGLTWDSRALARSLGARRTRDGRGVFTDAMQQVRASVLLTAHARGVMAIESAHAVSKDVEGAENAAKAARADGFTGMMARNPAHLAAINKAFEPTGDELADAQAIVATFASNPGQESVAHKGQRIGAPELARARRLLGQEDAPGMSTLQEARPIV